MSRKNIPPSYGDPERQHSALNQPAHTYETSLFYRLYYCTYSRNRSSNLNKVKLSSSSTVKFPRASNCIGPIGEAEGREAHTLGPDDGGEPVVEVVALGPSGAVGGVEVQQLLLNPLPRRRHRRPAARTPRAHAPPASSAAPAGGPNAGGEGEAGVGERGRRGHGLSDDGDGGRERVGRLANLLLVRLKSNHVGPLRR